MDSPRGPARTIARTVTLASFVLACAVTANQVLSEGKLSWNWLYVAWAVAVLGALYAEVLSPGAPLAEGAGGDPRGRRRMYLRQLQASVADMETVGIATQGEFALGLRQVYVEVSLAPQPLQDTADEPYLGHLGRTGGPVGERRPLTSFLHDGTGQVFAIIGGPGSGKTTLMRETALDLCHRPRPWERSRQRAVPLLLYLRDHAHAILAGDPPDLAEVAADAGWVAGRVPAAWIRQQLDRGRCLVMLDGLDEVADEDQRARVVAWTRRQIERFPGNHFLLTSRPHGYLSNPLPSVNVLQVRRFTGEQIGQFLHNWYYAIECRAQGASGRRVQQQAELKADDLIRRLRDRPALYDLAANPLLLTMIANVHRYRDALPGSRAALYGEMCEVLVHRRQEKKGLPDRTGLRGPQKEHIVQRLALAMMRGRVRDLTVADACAAIDADVRRASAELPPEDFLAEVSRSGLLVEREQGRYAFAHLTLQEYLAGAALVGGGSAELAELVDAVDDPWWREATLLWAANADASPVVAACLQSGTARALALAFDCADEARSLEPELRTALEDMLAHDPGDADPERQRLITAVKAARALRETIRLTDDTAVCARPVTNELYALFLQAERAEGRYHPDSPGHRASGEPVVGMWAEDAERFVAWLNGLFADGTTYRLPTPGELTDPAIGLVSGLDGHRVWSRDDGDVRLHVPSGVPSPPAPDAERLGAYLLLDLRHTLPYLRLALAPPDPARVDAYGELFESLKEQPFGEDSDNLRPTLRLFLLLTMARSLTSALTAIRASVALEPAWTRRPPALALARHLETTRMLAAYLDVHVDLTLDHDLDHALDLVLTADRSIGGVQDPDRVVALTVDRARALDRLRPYLHDRGTVETLARALHRTVGLARRQHEGNRSNTLPDLGAILDTVRERTRRIVHDLTAGTGDGSPFPGDVIGTGQDLQAVLEATLGKLRVHLRNRARTFGFGHDFDGVREFDLALPRVRGLLLAHDHDIDEETVRDSARSLVSSRYRHRVRVLGLDIDLGRELQHVLAQDSDLDTAFRAGGTLHAAGHQATDYVSASATALDGTVRQNAIARDIGHRQDLVAAYQRLLGRWRYSHDRGTVLGFAEFLASLTSEAGTRTPEPVGALLRSACALLNTPSALAQAPTERLSAATRLVLHARSLVTPLLSRVMPLDGEDLGCARIELLAAATMLRDASQADMAELLTEAVRNLIALQAQSDDPQPSGEVLLLIHA
ncbi:NACHT domain-containing NTPase [Actinomadura sp. WMMB 499]|uniref:NACHT domain-containing protein n=1 Tax=Actinomadura sp. WMMB 499 TaxID=1219491 RepID=UPI00159D3990|nr:NACHT domain-containing protein [Actinomadura sp. WMMB 499]